MNKNAKTLIFDLDGTLIDSMGTYAYVIITLLEENNTAYPDDVVKVTTPLGYEGAAKYCIEELGLPLPLDKAVARMKELARYEYENNIPAKETVIETLKTLKKEGYSLNVLTASPHLLLDPCLCRIGVYDLFDNLWSSDDFGTTKSDVRIYHMAAERLCVKVEDCIFFDDNIGALSTVAKSGMGAVGVYDKSSAEYEDDMRAIADIYIYKMEEFLELRNNI